uniref:hypothetical protein n=1 Tax=Lentinus flexipes TaxID=3163629 RepID=UPI002263FEF6|nr:hypothetical protein OSR58_mgp05 [Ganoderma flexipes]UYX56956.1 hypothetical protein [Ganoderma flexipes]
MEIMTMLETTLQTVLQNEHIVEYACVTVFTVFGLATVIYLRHRNKVNDNNKPDLDLDSDYEITINGLSSKDYVPGLVRFKDGNYVKVEDKGTDTLGIHYPTVKVLPIKVNLFEKSDYY